MSLLRNMSAISVNSFPTWLLLQHALIGRVKFRYWHRIYYQNWPSWKYTVHSTGCSKKASFGNCRQKMGFRYHRQNQQELETWSVGEKLEDTYCVQWTPRQTSESRGNTAAWKSIWCGQANVCLSTNTSPLWFLYPGWGLLWSCQRRQYCW